MKWLSCSTTRRDAAPNYYQQRSMRTVKFSFTESSANYDDAIQTVQAKPHEKSEIYVTISTRQTGGANERSLRAERAGQVVLWMPHHCTGNGIEEHWKKGQELGVTPILLAVGRQKCD